MVNLCRYCGSTKRSGRLHEVHRRHQARPGHPGQIQRKGDGDFRHAKVALRRDFQSIQDPQSGDVHCAAAHQRGVFTW